jgi:hypothetical protein
MFSLRVKSWIESLRGNVLWCWWEGLGYSFDDTFLWSQDDWKKAEAEQKTIQQRIGAGLHFA